MAASSSGAPLPAVVVPPPGGRWRWIPIVVVGLAMLEVASRVEDRVSYGMPILTRIETSNDLVLRDTVGARGRPNAIFRRWKLDSLGFRGPDIPVTPAPGVVRIVTAGASETFGLYEAANKEYPRQLEDSLRSRVAASCPGSDAPKVEVVNAALPGMALPSLAHHLTRVIARIQPSVVVIYASPGFYLNDRAPALARNVRSDTALRPRKAYSLRFVDRVSTQLKALAPAPLLTWSRQRVTRFTLRKYPDDWRFKDVPADRVQQYEDDLRATVGAVRAIGAQPLLATYVNATMAPGFNDPDLLVAWEYQFPRAPQQVIPAFHAEATRRTAQVAADSAVALVDLERAFEGHWDGAFADFVHFTNAGSATVASALTSALVTPGTDSGCAIRPASR
ncbi:MAG: hypothetical protein H7066_05595 [Cytophagaceae bacterium]|nr:hypothetical protein [Gemmatimonadaceae bacterium]